MMSPAERYERDPVFHALVAWAEAVIENAQFTPTELREAVILAATRVAMRRPALLAEPMPGDEAAPPPEQRDALADYARRLREALTKIRAHDGMRLEQDWADARRIATAALAEPMPGEPVTAGGGDGE